MVDRDGGVLTFFFARVFHTERIANSLGEGVLGAAHEYKDNSRKKGRSHPSQLTHVVDTWKKGQEGEKSDRRVRVGVLWR